MRKYRYIKLVTTEKRRNYLVSEPNYHTIKFFTKKLLTIEMRRTQTLMNEPVSSVLPILDLKKTVMYEFWYDYVKPKFSEKAKLCFMDIDSFIVRIKTDDTYNGIVEFVETKFDIFNYEFDRSLPKGKNKNVI